nr:CMD domain protein [Caldimonas sp.]
MSAPHESDTDVVDRAAGLAAGDPLHRARRFRVTVVEATQASHDALLDEPVPGLSTADRVRVAEHVCTLAGAKSLARHYAQRLGGDAPGAGRSTSGVAPASAALPAMLAFAGKLTTDPRLGDRAALDELRRAGLDDAAIVALAQLVAFVSYQLRVVAGLSALAALKRDEARGAGGRR